MTPEPNKPDQPAATTSPELSETSMAETPATELAPEPAPASASQPEPASAPQPESESTSQPEPASAPQPERAPAAASSTDIAAAVEPTPPRKPITIGSQRDAADKSLKPTKPKAVQSAVANPIDLSGKPPADPAPAEPAPEIHSTAGLSDDVDAEIEAALGGLSMDQIVDTAQADDDEIEPNTRLKGTVTKIHEDHVFIKLKNQYEGVAALHHFKEAPAEGDFVDIIVRSRNKEDGLYELAVPGAAVGVADWDDIDEGGVVEARVTGSNTGGLEVMVNSIRGFIPASQIDRIRVEDFSQYTNEKFPCVVLEVNPDKRKLVLSRRAVLERENEEKRKQLLQELEAGQLRDGVITRLMDFGAFCDLGGIEGLIHISKLSWSRVKHPSEAVAVGENVKVKVEKLDLDANRISLSLRDTLENPWNKVANDFNVNDIVQGTVTRIADFGAFVKIAPGVEGLVHISELAYHRVSKVSSVLQQGQEIDVKILSIDSDAQKIALSHKSCQAPPTPKSDKSKEEEVEQPARDLAVRESDQPLKGGTGRSSGGDSVGLNW